MVPNATRLPSTLVDRPWVIARQRLQGVVEGMLVRSAAIAHMDLPAIEAAVQAAASAPLGRMVGTVAVIPVCGVITQKSDFYSWWYGGTSVERLTASVRQYLNDPSVTAIVFDVDSPGGDVYGVPEFAEELFAARGVKKLIAVANPFMASAGYWTMAACDEVYVLPSGQVGSIGCYTLHEDLSAMLERIGVNITFVQYGEHKTEGNPYEPLSEEAHAEMQSSVDFYGTLFDKFVAKCRDKSMDDIKANFGQGRMFRAPDAKKVGMVDGVSTLDKVLQKLAPRGTRSLATAAVPTPAAPVAAPIAAEAQAAKKADSVDPNEDGTCPDGYTKDDDGMCHLDEGEGTKATAAAAQRQRDQDSINGTLGVLESV